MLNIIMEKWNIVYAIMFAVGSGFLVDIWAGFATVTLFSISLLLFIIKICKSLEDA